MPVQLSVRTIGADLVRRGLEDLGAEIPKISRLRIYQSMLKVRTRLRAPAPKPSYPIRWDSERQRRFVLAMLSERGGLPYRRSGRYQKGWNIVKTGTGYRIENNSPGALHIGGDHSGRGQSNIHQGRWPLFQNIVEEEIRGLPQDIESHITYYSRRKGF
jgi:hypothetical protein